MYRLSKLPLEILYSIFDCLEPKDLITMGRLNTWYGYKISTVITERVKQDIEKGGWRIHMDILATSHPPKKTNSSHYVTFSSDLALLSDFVRINPATLTLEFKLYPLEDNGMDHKRTEDTKNGENSLVIFETIRTNISLVAYFAQVSTAQSEVKRLQQVNQAGSAMMNDEKMWMQLNDFNKKKNNGTISDNGILGSAVMGTGCKVCYSVNNVELKTAQDDIDDDVVQVKIEDFKQKHELYKNHEHQKQVELDNPAVLDFTKILVTPDWWIQQMTDPFDENQNANYMYYEHALW